MHINIRQASQGLIVLCFLSLAACASKEMILETRLAEVPVGVDLTGFWRALDNPDALRFTGIENVQDLTKTKELKDRSKHQKILSSSSARVFLEFGKSLKITQTEYSLFISYDRSIVEEYTFGENRLVSIGPIEAQRVSGWQDNKFVVYTLGASGTILFETWYLANDDQILVRDIRIAKGDNEIYRHNQFFEPQ